MNQKGEVIMAERRSLVEGMKAATSDVDRAKAEEFVFNRKPPAGRQPQANEPTPAPSAREGKGTPSGNAHGRVPLTTRIRSDYAAALKRASLERQLAGQTPNTLQDILEDAVGPWLRSNGYLI